MIRITGGQVLTPVGLVEADVWVERDTVVAVGGDGRLHATQIIDATGMLVGPGFVDLHTHLRDPGQTWKEDVLSGSRAAAAGGYTAVVAMPNTDPPIDNRDVVAELRAKAEDIGLIQVVVAAALTVGREGRVPVDMVGLHADGVRMFTDDGDSIGSSDLMLTLLEQASELAGVVVAQHAEDRALSGDGHLSTGPVAQASGLPAIPSEAEWAVIARDLQFAKETGGHYHAQHLSTAEAVDLIREAKKQSIRVTAEVTPHHLTFHHDHLGSLDPNLKMYPPIRSKRDRDLLIRGLADGTIDAVATDHAPHSVEEKSVGFEGAPRGVIGLETAAAAVWGVLPAPERFFEVMSLNPARIIGLDRHGALIQPGSPANLVVFDPNREWTPEEFASKSENSPFLGRRMVGRPVVTIFEGQITHHLEAAS